MESLGPQASGLGLYMPPRPRALPAPEQSWLMGQFSAVKVYSNLYLSMSNCSSMNCSLSRTQTSYLKRQQT